MNKFWSSEDVVVQSLGHRIDLAAQLRHLAGGTTWPVFGMTHDLVDRDVVERLIVYGALGPRKTDAIICASSAARNLMKHYAEKIHTSGVQSVSNLQFPIVAHGVDWASLPRLPKNHARELLGIDRDTIVFLYLGRLSLRYKADLLGLIECFARRFQGKRAVLCLAGGASYSGIDSEVAFISNKIAQISADRQIYINLHSNVSDDLKTLLLSSADIFVSPANSLQESFGLSLVEAMYYQLPVIATKWSGYTDIVIDDSTGYLVDTRWRSNSAETSGYRSRFSREALAIEAVSRVLIDWNSFGARMEELYADRKRREAFGSEGLDRARKSFSVHAMIKGYSDAWSTALLHKEHSIMARTFESSLDELAQAVMIYSGRED
ncbi:glycosyltransferase family 4 protein [Rhizobium laguerreae]|uniref:glycosyltransferase family 4 protein n=1 Tax=Rhizobium laguerreae TaxID=1076926 RepID=UPI001C900AFB|nr:glycosyltransferase family 4 protein [Rhizobium laguerreae]MBY3181041.1 glycosyltransferase family 4 protein [Rhizobium laguerreae]